MSVKVKAYGQFMPLNQVANITVSGGTMLQVTPSILAALFNLSLAQFEMTLV